MAITFLNNAGIAFEHVIADENRELTEQFDIHQAPTLVVVRNGKMEQYVNLSNIRKYIDTAAKA
jgi:ribonucleoside-triphosphate reductase